MATMSPASAETLAALAEGAPGSWSWDGERLDAPRRVAFQEHVERPSASLIKVPILAALYEAVEEGRARLDETVVMTAEDQVTGSGVLMDLTPGRAWTLRDLATLMITVSDNTATNLLLDRLGVEPVNQLAERLDLHQTRVLRRLQRLPVGAEGTNHTTAADMTRLMALIARGRVVSWRACQAMADLLRRCQADAVIAAPTPAGHGLVGEPAPQVVYHKTGLLAQFRGDAGFVLWHGGGYALTVMGQGVPEAELAPWMIRIGRGLAEHLRS
jgi:beta-lactamase class A